MYGQVGLWQFVTRREGEIQEIKQIEKQRVGSMGPTRTRNSDIGSLSAQFPQRVERKKQSERDILLPGTHPCFGSKDMGKEVVQLGTDETYLDHHVVV